MLSAAGIPQLLRVSSMEGSWCKQFHGLACRSSSHAQPFRPDEFSIEQQLRTIRPTDCESSYERRQESTFLASIVLMRRLSNLEGLGVPCTYGVRSTFHKLRVSRNWQNLCGRRSNQHPDNGNPSWKLLDARCDGIWKPSE